MLFIQESMILDALTATYLIDSGVVLGLASLSDRSMKIHLYFGDSVPIDLEYVSDFDTTIAQRSFWSYEMIGVEAQHLSDCPYGTLREVVGAGSFPLFAAPEALNIDETNLSRELPWMFRSPLDRPVISTSVPELANLNVAELTARVSLLGLDLSGVDRVGLSVSQKDTTLSVVITCARDQQVHGEALSERLRSRLSGRPEVAEPWRWVIDTNLMDTDLFRPQLSSNERTLLSRA